MTAQAGQLSVSVVIVSRHRPEELPCLAGAADCSLFRTDSLRSGGIRFGPQRD